MTNNNYSHFYAKAFLDKAITNELNGLSNSVFYDALISNLPVLEEKLSEVLNQAAQYSFQNMRSEVKAFIEEGHEVSELTIDWFIDHIRNLETEFMDAYGCAGLGMEPDFLIEKSAEAQLRWYLNNYKTDYSNTDF